MAALAGRVKVGAFARPLPAGVDARGLAGVDLLAALTLEVMPPAGRGARAADEEGPTSKAGLPIQLLP